MVAAAGRARAALHPHDAWDPIGVGDTPEAWGEYDGYAAGVAQRLRNIPDPDEAARSVAEYLLHIERDYMADPQELAQARIEQLAATLVAWHTWSYTHGGRPPMEWLPD